MPVPRADLLTDVTAKHPIFHMALHWLWNGASQFNCEITDALAAIHHIRLDDGVRWTRIDATGTRSAVVCDWRVRLQVNIQKHLRQKEVTALFLADQQTVLSNPT